MPGAFGYPQWAADGRFARWLVPVVAVVRVGSGAGDAIPGLTRPAALVPIAVQSGEPLANVPGRGEPPERLVVVQRLTPRGISSPPTGPTARNRCCGNRPDCSEPELRRQVERALERRCDRRPITGDVAPAPGPTTRVARACSAPARIRGARSRRSPNRPLLKHRPPPADTALGMSSYPPRAGSLRSESRTIAERGRR